jgi:hypothetical protein
MNQHTLSKLLVVSSLLALGGCSATTPPAGAAHPAAASESAAPAAATVTTGGVAPGSGESPAGAVASAPAITAEGAPVLPPVTTPRQVQAGDPARRCARLTTLIREDLGRMLAYLGSTPAEAATALDRVGPAHARLMAEKCPRATPEVLACIEAADNVLSGMAQCGINAGKPFPEQILLDPITLSGLPWERAASQEGERTVTDAAGAAQLRAALLGRWRSPARAQSSWTFSDDGTAQLSDGVQDERFSFVTTSASRFYGWAPGPDGQRDLAGTYSAVTDGQTLYVAPLPGGGARRIETTGPTVVVAGGIWLFSDLGGTPRCTGFSSIGEPVRSARCAWRTDRDRRRLSLIYNLGFDRVTGQPASDAGGNLMELAGHLMIENGTSLYRRADEGPAASR